MGAVLWEAGDVLARSPRARASVKDSPADRGSPGCGAAGETAPRAPAGAAAEAVDRGIAPAPARLDGEGARPRAVAARWSCFSKLVPCGLVPASTGISPGAAATETLEGIAALLSCAWDDRGTKPAPRPSAAGRTSACRALASCDALPSRANRCSRAAAPGARSPPAGAPGGPATALAFTGPKWVSSAARPACAVNPAPSCCVLPPCRALASTSRTEGAVRSSPTAGGHAACIATAGERPASAGPRPRPASGAEGGSNSPCRRGWTPLPPGKARWARWARKPLICAP